MGKKTEKELLQEVENLRAQVKKLKARKKYGLVWDAEKEPEKVVLDCRKKLPILVEDKKKEIKGKKDELMNLLIEGDNYHSLSVLNYTHKEKVDVIYIDPPYNTGNKDFVYNDHFVDSEDNYRHSKWLSFMEKRLKLCKNLLKKSGTIFISIDSNEFSQLKLLCDEIFGEKNFICDFIWKKRSGGGYTNSLINYSHEYILTYAKDVTSVSFNDRIKDEEKLSKIYKLTDEKGVYKRRDLRKSGSSDLRTDRPTMYYPVISPNKTKIFPIRPDGRDGRWSCAEKRYLELLENEEVEFVQVGEKWKVYTKERPFNEKGELKKEKYESLLLDVAINTQGTYDLKDIFPENDTIFNNPKPKNLIAHFIKIAGNSKSLVLDFFAGSGTTGHAILDLNKIDNGKRKFILCTDNQKSNGDDLRIAEDICYPRVKKIIKGYKNSKKQEVEGLGGNLRYYKTDFIETENLDNATDQDKIDLTYKTGEMIAIREETFEEIEKDNWWQIFSNGDKLTAIYFKEDKSKLQKLIEKLDKTNKKVNLYIFSWGKNEYVNEFGEYKNIKIKDIPEPLIEVYKEVSRL